MLGANVLALGPALRVSLGTHPTFVTGTVSQSLVAETCNIKTRRPEILGCSRGLLVIDHCDHGPIDRFQLRVTR